MVEDKEVYEKLLYWFDADRNKANEKFTLIYGELIGFFKTQSNLPALPEEYAIETIFQFAKSLRAKLQKDEEIKDPSAFIYKIAWNILHTAWRGKSKEALPFDGISKLDEPASDPTEDEDTRVWWRWKNRRLQCMKRCVQALPAHEYDLLQEHVQGGKQDREELAKRLGITLVNLRLRVHRIRERLKECRASCLKKPRKTSK